MFHDDEAGTAYLSDVRDRDAEAGELDRLPGVGAMSTTSRNQLNALDLVNYRRQRSAGSFAKTRAFGDGWQEVSSYGTSRMPWRPELRVVSDARI